MGKKLEQANNLFQHKYVKLFRRVLLIVFAFLLVFDVLLVTLDPERTISKAVLNSSPQWLVIIWLWGVLSANFFFPRSNKNIWISKFGGVFLLLCASLFLVYIGYKLDQKEVVCNEQGIIETPIFTHVVANNSETWKAQKLGLITCETMAKTENVRFRLDLTSESKLSLLILGALFGYFFWPQRLPEEDIE